MDKEAQDDINRRQSKLNGIEQKFETAQGKSGQSKIDALETVIREANSFADDTKKEIDRRESSVRDMENQISQLEKERADIQKQYEALEREEKQNENS